MVSIYSLSAYKSLAAGIAGNISDLENQKIKNNNVKINGVEKETEKIDSKKVTSEEIQQVNKLSNDDLRLQKLLERLKSLAVKLGITVNASERVETILQKINQKLTELENVKNNPNLNVFRSEYEVIKNEYKSIVNGDPTLLTGLDILSRSNKAVMGINLK